MRPRKQRRLRVGLCLSGGGVYGAFQAGVIQSLRNHNIRIRAYSGSSIGAINSILASGSDPNLLPRFWLNIPRYIETELEFAQKQWLGCLLALGRAKRIGIRAGREHWESLTCFGKGAEILLSTLGFGSECYQVGESAARNFLNETMDEREDKGPILSIRTARHLRNQLAEAKPMGPVYASVCELQKFRAHHILRMRDQLHCEVSNTGSYLQIDSSNAADCGIASASLPLVFGKNNNINPTHFFDGGLYDNLPVGPIAEHFDAGDIDCVLVVDVSRGASQFRTEIMGIRMRRATPAMYIGLERGRNPMRSLLDFSKAKPLYTLGLKAGDTAAKRWFADSFDPVGSFLDSAATLPASHVIHSFYPG